MTFLGGLSAFPITPADSHGHVDTAALRQLVGRLAAARVGSIGVLGSTGTYMYLTREERRRALDAAVDEASATAVIAGIGALRTDDAVAFAQDARAIGVKAGLLAAVSYTPLDHDEVFEHFLTVARDGGLPLVIYDNPTTTHFRFTPELVARLALVPGIVAIKNPAGNRDETVQHLSSLRALLPQDFSVGYSGDWNATEAMIAGADTWYSVLGGLFPKACLAIIDAAGRGDTVEARRLNAALEPVWDLFRTYSSMRVIHVMVDLLGICRTEPPRPILPLPESVKPRIADVLSGLSSEFAS